ncbi:MAG: M60 family metallopeptidase [Lachnospiraceae bacterium]|nr:M60 family metallopeptidase [Lachnospiraceae bacterium]
MRRWKSAISIITAAVLAASAAAWPAPAAAETASDGGASEGKNCSESLWSNLAPPVFYGATKITVPLGTEFSPSDPRFRTFAIDFEDGDIMPELVSGEDGVDTSAEGTYELAYAAQDSHGNRSELTVPVTVASGTDKITVERTIYSNPGYGSMTAARCTRGDQQILGIYTPGGTSFEARTISTFSDMGARSRYDGFALYCFGNDSAKEKDNVAAATLRRTDTDWVTFTADDRAGNPYSSVPLVAAPDGASLGEVSKIEIRYDKDMPALTYYRDNDDRNLAYPVSEFKQDWIDGGADFAVVESDEMLCLVPAVDREASARHLEEFFDYWEKAIAKFEEYTGLSLNPADPSAQSFRAKYFAKADVSGVGAAYYSTEYIAANGPSMWSMVEIGSWCGLHEVGHGYQGSFGSGALGFAEVGNNIIGHYIQMDDSVHASDSDWLGDIPANEERWNAQRENEYPGDVRTRLYFAVNLLDALALREYNRTGDADWLLNGSSDTPNGGKVLGLMNAWYNREVYGGRSMTNIDAYAESAAELFGVDITPYFEAWHIEVSESTRETLTDQLLPMYSVLKDLAPTSYRDCMGDGERAYAPVTNEVFKGLSGGTLTITVDIADLEAVKGQKIRIANGADEPVREVELTGSAIRVSGLPVGSYRVDFPASERYLGGAAGVTIREGEDAELAYVYTDCREEKMNTRFSIRVNPISGSGGITLDFAEDFRSAVLSSTAGNAGILRGISIYKNIDGTKTLARKVESEGPDGAKIFPETAPETISLSVDDEIWVTTDSSSIDVYSNGVPVAAYSPQAEGGSTAVRKYIVSGKGLRYLAKNMSEAYADSLPYYSLVNYVKQLHKTLESLDESLLSDPYRSRCTKMNFLRGYYALNTSDQAAFSGMVGTLLGKKIALDQESAALPELREGYEDGGSVIVNVINEGLSSTGDLVVVFNSGSRYFTIDGGSGNWDFGSLGVGEQKSFTVKPKIGLAPGHYMAEVQVSPPYQAQTDSLGAAVEAKTVNVSVEVKYPVKVTPPEERLYENGNYLTYNGQEQVVFSDTEAYTVDNGVAFDAGTFTATLTLNEGYQWADGTSEPLERKYFVASRPRPACTGINIYYAGSPDMKPRLTGTTSEMEWGKGGNANLSFWYPCTDGETLLTALNANSSGYIAVRRRAGENENNEPASVPTYVYLYNYSQAGVTKANQPRPIEGMETAYDGSLQQMVFPGSGFVLEGDLTAVEAGEYEVRATPEPGVTWRPETTNPNDYDNSGKTITIRWTITAAPAPAAPEGLSGSYPSMAGAWDGSIRGTTAKMEWAADVNGQPGDYSPCVDGQTTVGPAGTYYVRYKELPSERGGINYPAGEAKTVIVPDAKGRIVGFPDVKTDLVYNGKLQTGVSEGEGCSLSGPASAADAGSYRVTAHLEDGCFWEDGTQEDLVIDWTIAKNDWPAAPSGLVGIAPEAESGAGTIEGLTDQMEFYQWLPSVSSPVFTSCESGMQLAPGKHYFVRFKETGNAKASGGIRVFVPNYENRFIQKPSAVRGLVYNGEKQEGVRDGIGYSVTDGSAVDAGRYEARLQLDAGYTWEDGSEGDLLLEWSIARAEAKPAPSGLEGVEPLTYGAADGQILGTTAGMEYDVSAEFADPTACGEGSTAVPAGDYYVRYTADPANEAVGGYTLVRVPQKERIKVAKPLAISGLTQLHASTGLTKTFTGVPDREGYSLSGEISSDVIGEHTVIAVPDLGYVWEDGSSGSVSVTWTLGAAPEPEDTTDPMRVRSESTDITISPTVAAADDVPVTGFAVLAKDLTEKLDDDKLLKAYDIELTDLNENRASSFTSAKVFIPYEGDENLKVVNLGEDEAVEIESSYNSERKGYEFSVSHFSLYALAEQTADLRPLILNPKITRQPGEIVLSRQSTLLGSILAEGEGLAYQWQYLPAGAKSWQDFEGQTGSELRTAAPENQEGCLIRCVVKDRFGNDVVSDSASLREPEACSLAVYSRTNANPDSVADLTVSPSGELYEGDEVTVSAPIKPGYKFLSWNEVEAVEDGKASAVKEEKLSENRSYTFTLEGDTQLAALYKENGKATVEIKVVNGAQYKVGTDAAVQSGGTASLRIGETLALTALDADKVLHWKNESGKIIGTGATLSFTVTGNTTVSLVYRSEAENQAYLQFLSDYGQVLSYYNVSTSSAVTYPTIPTKFGYTFEKWVFEGTDTEATETSIREAIPTSRMITVVPQYSKDEQTYSVTANYRSGETEIRASDSFCGISVGTGYTLTAPAVEGYTFECWKDAGGSTVLGYDPDYFMLVKEDSSLTACYVPEGTEAEAAKPVIALTGITKTPEGSTHKVIGEATRSVPEGYTLVEHGMLYGKTELPEENFIYGTEGVRRFVSSNELPNGVLYMNIKVSSDDLKVYFRGYMVVQTSDGNQETYYTAIQGNSYSGIV